MIPIRVITVLKMYNIAKTVFVEQLYSFCTYSGISPQRIEKNFICELGFLLFKLHKYN